MNRVLHLVLLVVFLAACADTEAPMPHRAEQMRRHALSKIDTTACAADGGEIKQVCRLGLPVCVRPHSDGGTLCEDKSDCQGNCIQREPWAPPGTQTIGVCESTDEPCGCKSLVIEGKAREGVCED
jgi:putative hemolysin